MDTNPFSLLTFIVAPAILTNASSVSALATSNRLGRATDRARAISTLLESHMNDTDPWRVAYLHILGFAERRILMLCRALNAYYVSIGAFASAALVSLFGAVFFAAQWQWLGMAAMGMSLLIGVVGVGGLAFGSAILVMETRITLKSLSEETEFLLSHHRGRKTS